MGDRSAVTDVSVMFPFLRCSMHAVPVRLQAIGQQALKNQPVADDYLHPPGLLIGSGTEVPLAPVTSCTKRGSQTCRYAPRVLMDRNDAPVLLVLADPSAMDHHLVLVGDAVNTD
jgi:hypothetical protein